MFVPYKDRELKLGQLVAVHFNSHKDTYSIVNMNSANTLGHVLGYSNNITLTNCRFKIDKSKQQAVRDTGVKDRHAYVIGYVESLDFHNLDKQLHYSPKFLDSFIDKSEQFNECPTYLTEVNKVSFSVINDKPLVKFE